MGELAVVDALDAQERTGQAPRDTGLSPLRFGQYCEEIRNQPAWRRESDKCAEYYDGNQLDGETLALLEQRGLPPLITNLIKPTIDVVLGMEAKTRSDWRVGADDDQSLEVAEALNAKLHEAEREARADRACSDAYASQIKAGIGWVEVSRNADPFAFQYRVNSVHRREIAWDWTDQSPDLINAKYLTRKRWFDLEAAEMFFPKRKELLRAAGLGWHKEWLERFPDAPYLAQSFEIERGASIEDYEWRDAVRGRIALIECDYRQHVRGYVLRLPSGRAVELDMQNPMHAAAVGRGLLRPIPALYTRINQSVWAGPHKMLDRPTKRRRFQYVPFWGHREDLTGAPYGLIRSMISPQDKINARDQKLQWLLSAKRVLMDSDAIDNKQNDIRQVLEELARADAVVQLNPKRLNKDGFKVDDNLGMSEQQFQILQDAMQHISRVSGVFQAMLGDASGNQPKSGVALDTLVDQGSTTLAEINDNYAFGRRMVGEMLLDLIKEDMLGREVEVLVGESGRPKKSILLNRQAFDPQTQMVAVQNDVARAQVRVALEDVPSTPTYRRQQVTMLAEVMKAMPPNLQAIITPFYLEATDLPKRRELADMVRKALGLAVEGPDGQDPEKAQLMQLVEQLKAALEEATNSPMAAEVKAKAERALAESERARAAARKLDAETGALLDGKENEKPEPSQTEWQ